MNTIETMRMFCDGSMSVHDIRALMLSMGHSAEDISEAIISLSYDGDWRVGRYQKHEWQAELFLNTQVAKVTSD